MKTTLAVVAAGLAASTAPAQPVVADLTPPTLDIWNYPFNQGGGGEIEASTFAALLMPGFDDRDGQFVMAWDTSADVEPGRGTASYRVRSAVVTARISQGDRFIYDPTRDPLSQILAPETDDPGRPVELFPVGYRNGFTAQTWVASPVIAGPPAIPPAQGARNAFVANDDGSRAMIDVSNHVREGFEAFAFSIGATSATAPGQVVPIDADFTFEVDLSDPAARAYLQRSLDEGLLVLGVSSLHAVTGPGSTEFPKWYTSENPLGVAPALHLEVCIGPAADWNCDGGVDTADLFEFIAGFFGVPPDADFNADGVTDTADFFEFIAAFFA